MKKLIKAEIETEIKTEAKSRYVVHLKIRYSKNKTSLN